MMQQLKTIVRGYSSVISIDKVPTIQFKGIDVAFSYKGTVLET